MSDECKCCGIFVKYYPSILYGGNEEDDEERLG
jgi:hypothetical protein